MARKMTLLLALALVAGACSSTPATRITLQAFGDGAEITAYRSLLSAFTREHPDIQVNLVPVAKQGDHMAKLTTGFAAGNPPDVFLLNYRRFGQFATKGVIEPAASHLADGPDISDFYPQALDAFKVGGVQTCLPQNISSLVVYYNKTLFREAGLGDAPDPDWKWPDFVAAAKAMTKDTDGDGDTDIYGLGVEPNLIRLAPFVWQAGGEVVDDTDDPKRTTLLGEREIEAMAFFIGLRRHEKVSPEKAEAESEDYESRFASGRVGMLLESRRVVPTLREAEGLDWDVAPLPSHREKASILHSDAYCVSKSSTRKDEAFTFIRWALSGEGAAVLARTGRTVPALRSVSTSDAFLSPGAKPASAKVFLDAIPFIRRVPNIGTWNEIETKADPIIDEWYYGLEAPEALGIEIDLATRALFAESGN